MTKAGKAAGATGGGGAMGCRRSRCSGLPWAKQRRGRERGWHCDAAGGDGDIGRRSGVATGAAGDSAMAATPLVAGGDPPPVISPRNGGDAGGEEAAATPWVVAAQPIGTQAQQQGWPREGSKLATGEGGTAPRMAAGGHGRCPKKVRAFRSIDGSIQGGKKEESMGLNSP